MEIKWIGHTSFLIKNFLGKKKFDISKVAKKTFFGEN